MLLATPTASAMQAKLTRNAGVAVAGLWQSSVFLTSRFWAKSTVCQQPFLSLSSRWVTALASRALAGLQSYGTQPTVATLHLPSALSAWTVGRTVPSSFATDTNVGAQAAANGVPAVQSFSEWKQETDSHGTSTCPTFETQFASQMAVLSVLTLACSLAVGLQAAECQRTLCSHRCGCCYCYYCCY